jgi:predicted proteasome-type protease
MTPKEKAIELVDKYNNSIMSFLSDNMKYQNAIKCALIAVDEILKANPIIPLQFMLESESLDAANEYWQEVQQELENLKNK